MSSEASGEFCCKPVLCWQAGALTIRAGSSWASLAIAGGPGISFRGAQNLKGLARMLLVCSGARATTQRRTVRLGAHRLVLVACGETVSVSIDDTRVGDYVPREIFADLQRWLAYLSGVKAIPRRSSDLHAFRVSAGRVSLARRFRGGPPHAQGVSFETGEPRLHARFFLDAAAATMAWELPQGGDYGTIGLEAELDELGCVSVLFWHKRRLALSAVMGRSTLAILAMEIIGS